MKVHMGTYVIDKRERLAIGWYVHNMDAPASRDTVIAFLDGVILDAIDDVVEKYETREGAR